MASDRVDLPFLRAALAARAAELAVALLGEPNRSMSGKRELRFGRKGSMAVSIAGPKAGLWHDHEVGAGGDVFDLIMRACAGGFKDAIEFAEQFVGQAPREPAPVSGGRERAVAAEDHWPLILRIWKEAVPIAGTLAEAYLTRTRLQGGRGLVALPPGIGGAVLRFHRSCPYGDARRPCMIALMRDIHTNEPRAIQRTALTADGHKIGRMTLGPKTGAAIKLSDDAAVETRLAIGEGLETVLSGMVFGYTPAWAVGDAAELEDFPVLSGIDLLTIVVDNDPVEKGQRGQNAALKCSKRWTDAGRLVLRALPQRPGADMNDVLIEQRTRGHLRAAGL
jgi:putative DNA primase/helicase